MRAATFSSSFTVWYMVKVGKPDIEMKVLRQPGGQGIQCNAESLRNKRKSQIIDRDSCTYLEVGKKH